MTVAFVVVVEGGSVVSVYADKPIEGDVAVLDLDADQVTDDDDPECVVIEGRRAWLSYPEVELQPEFMASLNI
jgi:hypothetical protein